jgi:hypothetical protein
MSRLQFYPLEISDDKLRYRFVSNGLTGDIIKLVSYENYEGDLWNLAFGDADEDETDFDDKTISDNGDMRKVIRTIFETGLIFTDTYPKRNILIIPVDKQHQMLYNRVFKDKYDEIETDFTIEGINSKISDTEKYAPSKIYRAFILTRKSFD